MSGPADEGDGRVASRAPAAVRVKLRFADTETFIRRYQEQLRRGVIFIATRAPRPVGSPLRFEFLLSDGAPVFRGSGTVASVVGTSSHEADELRRSGMDVAFQQLDADSQRLLERCGEETTMPGLGVPDDPSGLHDFTPSPVASPEAEGALGAPMEREASIPDPRRATDAQRAAGGIDLGAKTTVYVGPTAAAPEPLSFELPVPPPREPEPPARMAEPPARMAEPRPREPEPASKTAEPVRNGKKDHVPHPPHGSPPVRTNGSASADPVELLIHRYGISQSRLEAALAWARRDEAGSSVTPTTHSVMPPSSMTPSTSPTSSATSKLVTKTGEPGDVELPGLATRTQNEPASIEDSHNRPTAPRDVVDAALFGPVEGDDGAVPQGIPDLEQDVTGQWRR